MTIRPDFLPELQEHKPDKLDKDCDRVFQALKGLTLVEKFGVLDQVREYLEMERANDSQ